MNNHRVIVIPASVRPRRTPLLMHGLYRFVHRPEHFPRVTWTAEKLASLGRQNERLYSLRAPGRSEPSPKPALVVHEVDQPANSSYIYDLRRGFYGVAELASANIAFFAEELHFHWLSLVWPGDAGRQHEDPRRVFQEAAQWFAETTGTDEIVAKSTERSLSAARRKLVAAIVDVASANGIDIETGEAG